MNMNATYHTQYTSPLAELTRHKNREPSHDAKTQNILYIAAASEQGHCQPLLHVRCRSPAGKIEYMLCALRLIPVAFTNLPLATVVVIHEVVKLGRCLRRSHISEKIPKRGRNLRAL